MGPFKSSLLKHTDFVIDYHTLIYDLESFIFNCIQLFCCLCGIPRLSGCMFYPTISLVLKSDVVISRSGPKKLNINSAVIVEGIMSVKNLKINGQPFTGCKCSDGGRRRFTCLSYQGRIRFGLQRFFKVQNLGWWWVMFDLFWNFWMVNEPCTTEVLPFVSVNMCAYITITTVNQCHRRWINHYQHSIICGVSEFSWTFVGHHVLNLNVIKIIFTFLNM